MTPPASPPGARLERGAVSNVVRAEPAGSSATRMEPVPTRQAGCAASSARTDGLKKARTPQAANNTTRDLAGELCPALDQSLGVELDLGLAGDD